MPDRSAAAATFATRHSLLLLRSAATVLVAVLLLAACKTHGVESSGGGAQPIPIQQGGAATYARSCARCHGANREGDGTSPALDAARMASLGDQPLRFVIAYGKGQMPAFGGLSEAQVVELINYLRGL
ncbi:MAG: cytochrome c [Ilumatobacteraceae bacterium]